MPIYAWQSGSASAIMYLFGPEEFGGLGDLLQKVEDIKAESEEERVKEMKNVSQRSVPYTFSTDNF